MAKFFKLFNKLEQNFHLGRATAVIAFLTLASRMTGFLRDSLLASKLGLSNQTDIYFTAFRVPDLIYNLLILGTLSVAFIPVFTGYYLKNKDEAWRIASSILNLAILITGGVCIIIFVFAKPLTKIIAPGFNEADLNSTVVLTRIFLLSPIIFTASSVISSTLLSLKKFIWVNTAPLLYNAGILVGILYFYPHFGLKGLAFGVVFGALLHILIQLPQAVSLGFKWRPSLSIKHPGVKQILRLVVPRILGLDISYVNLVIVSIVGSTLATGTISAFNFANNIQTVPMGIFAISTTLAIFPVLSEQFAEKQLNKFIATFNAAFIRILYFILPMSVYLLLLRAHIVRLLLGYGKCDWTCTITTFDTLGLLSFSLIAQSLVPLVSRAFYARHNTKTPVLIGVIAIALNAGLSYTLSFGLGVIGIALGFVIASVFQLILLMIFLHHDIQKEVRSQKITRESDYYIVSNSVKIIIASLVSGLVAYLILYSIAPVVDTHTIFGIFFQAGLAVGISGLVYLLITDMFGLPIAIQIRTALEKTIKFFNVNSSIQ